MSFDLYSILALVMMGAEAISLLVTIIVAVCRKGRLNVSQIESLIPLLTRQANGFLGAKIGPAKLAYVLSEIKALCAESNVDYSSSVWTDKVEYYLAADSQQKGGSDDENESKTCEGSQGLCQDSATDKKYQRCARYDARRY